MQFLVNTVITLAGDGTSTTAIIDLTELPVSNSANVLSPSLPKAKPESVAIVSVNGPTSLSVANASVSGKILNLVFSAPLVAYDLAHPNATSYQISVAFGYATS